MDPIAISAIGEILTTIVVSITLLVGAGITLRAWNKRATVLKAADAARLLEGMETVQHTLEDMRGEMADLNDRLDFTERLLSQAVERGEHRLPSGE